MAGARDVRSRLSRGWGELAPAYDLQMPLERAGVQGLVDLLAPKPDERVLDLGTGTGAVLRELASRSSRPYDVLGVDSSTEMLQRVPPLPAGWRLSEADVTGLPLADRSVDVLSASYLLHVLAEGTRQRALAEMLRVLRPGGRVGVLVPALPRGALRGPYCAALKLLMRRSESAFGLALIDAPAELERAALRVKRCGFIRRGYPSLCVLAHRPA